MLLRKALKIYILCRFSRIRAFWNKWFFFFNENIELIYYMERTIRDLGTSAAVGQLPAWRNARNPIVHGLRCHVLMKSPLHKNGFI